MLFLIYYNVFSVQYIGLYIVSVWRMNEIILREKYFKDKNNNNDRKYVYINIV